MASVAPIQGHFDGGEVSPKFYGRVDSERYKSALALCKNWIASLQGGLDRRPGTMYLGNVKDSTKKTRLIPFSFSTTQSYMLEFGNQYIRFWANYGEVLSGGVPYEVPSPYLTADLPLIRYVQSADVLYLVHPAYPPQKLQRYGQTSWVLVPCTFVDGPYQPINTTAITLTPSGTSGLVSLNFGPSQAVANMANSGTGTIRVTVTGHGYLTGQPLSITGVVGTTEANLASGYWIITVVDKDHFDLNGSVFVNAYVSGGTVVPAGTKSQGGANIAGALSDFSAAYIGQIIRISVDGVNWVSATPTGVINATNTAFNVQLNGTLPAATATKIFANGLWRPGAFGIGINFPGTIAFHEDRLCFSATPSNPQRIDGSSTTNYENFSPTKPDGTVTASNAISFSLNASDVNANAWLNSDEKSLVAGSVSAEWALRPSVNGEAITPTNVNAKRSTKWGSATINSVSVGKATIFVQRGARKLRELMYDFYFDGYRTTDLTELAEHITGSGVVDMCYQSIPISVVWLVRNDGVLIGMTYDRDLQQLRVGWHQHVLGGVSDSAGSPPIIESIATIPSPDGSRDDVWMIVKRFINGSSVRTIEYLTKIFEDIDPQENAFHLDAGLTYNVPLTITAITNANPAVVTSTAHGLSTGNQIRIDNVVGLNAAGGSAVNGKKFIITVLDANNFSLNATDLTAVGAYVSGGQARKLVTTISGINHLKGETVSIYADGAVHPPQVVNGSGQITLEIPSAVVSVGYAYNSDGQMLRLEAGSRNGTSLGKTRRTHRLGVMVHRSQGLLLGKSFSNLDPVQFRTQDITLNGGAPALFSGIETHSSDFDYDLDNMICFRVSQPFPCVMQAIMPMLETQDRA